MGSKVVATDSTALDYEAATSTPQDVVQQSLPLERTATFKDYLVRIFLD